MPNLERPAHAGAGKGGKAVTGLSADLVLRVGAAYSLAGEVYRAVAVRGAEVVAVSADPHGLDDLAGSTTRVVGDPALTVLPAFTDAHEHLLEAAKNRGLVPVEQARSVAEFAAAVGRAAAAAAEGQWVQTSVAWHESNLAEGRLPTRTELDAASPDRPVVARRGGHLAVANSAALGLAGITAATPDPPGGSIGHTDDGAERRGRGGGGLPGPGVRAAAHPPGAGGGAARGVGGLRGVRRGGDPRGDGGGGRAGRLPGGVAGGALSVRVRPLVRVPNDLGADAAITLVEGLEVHSGFGDDWLRLWGLKLVLDGGVLGAAMAEPYASDPTNRGHLNWDPEEMAQVCVAAVRRGWRIGTHAVGDRAVGVVLDVYERVVHEAGPLPPATLVVEHALVAEPAQQARAVRLGVGVTVQHTLLWNLGSEMLTTWGPQRTARANSIDQWLAAGAILAAGTDLTRPFNPLTSVWGMVTRATRAAGVQGPEHAIDRGAAIELSTAAGARLDREADRRGTIAPGRLADLVAYPADPFTVDIHELPELTPALTMVGGRAVHDPDGRVG